jgi:hypothetical protein
MKRAYIYDGLFTRTLKVDLTSGSGPLRACPLLRSRAHSVRCAAVSGTPVDGLVEMLAEIPGEGAGREKLCFASAFRRHSSELRRTATGVVCRPTRGSVPR